MAIKTTIVNEIMSEFGKTDPVTRKLVDSKVDEIVIDLLSQNEGRFSGLEEKQTITVNTTDTEYKLNQNFNSIGADCVVLDSNNDYAGEFDVVSHKEYLKRKANAAQYPGYTYGRVEYLSGGRSGPGYYLILGDEVGEAFTLEFFYYRDATAFDITIIKNATIIKKGVKGGFSQFNPQYGTDMEIYFRMRSGFRENISKTTNQLIMRPSKKTQRFNANMHDIGRGG